MGLKITTCLSNWAKLWTRRYKETKKPNCPFWRAQSESRWSGTKADTAHAPCPQHHLRGGQATCHPSSPTSGHTPIPTLVLLLTPPAAAGGPIKPCLNFLPGLWSISIEGGEELWRVTKPSGLPISYRLQYCPFTWLTCVCECVCTCAQLLSHVQFFAALWTVAHQAPLSMGLSSQEYWSGLPFPPPGDLPEPGIKPMSPALAGRVLYHCTTWESQRVGQTVVFPWISQWTQTNWRWLCCVFISSR